MPSSNNLNSMQYVANAVTFKYTPADEQKIYCCRFGSASRMGAASVASRPFMSYTTAQKTVMI